MSTSKLFSPIKVGNASLEHRIAMAPMTRFRADKNHVHSNGFAETHYVQRASVPGTLLITEATYISPRASGFFIPNVPGIYTEEQIAAWKKTTDAVHAKGCSMFLQLWAVGRLASPEALKQDGYDVVSASAIPVDDKSHVPREMTEDEINIFIDDHVQAAKNAIEAGFDGVEIHGANGFLIDGFIQDVTNQRTDRWGGCIENRSRFAIEVVKAVVDAISSDRVAIRLSPWNDGQGMKMEDPVPQYTHLIRSLRQFKLAYVHLVASTSENAHGEGLGFALETYDSASPVIITGGFDGDNVRKAVDEEYKKWDVIIGFGRHFTANPDLVFRVKEGLEFNKYDRNGFYVPETETGYNDYPFHPTFKAMQQDQTEGSPLISKVVSNASVSVVELDLVEQ